MAKTDTARASRESNFFTASSFLGPTPRKDGVKVLGKAAF
jgi:hypothetical protein